MACFMAQAMPTYFIKKECKADYIIIQFLQPNCRSTLAEVQPIKLAVIPPTVNIIEIGQGPRRIANIHC